MNAFTRPIAFFPHHCCGPARASPRTWCHNCNWLAQAMAINGKTKGPKLHHWGEVLHNHYIYSVSSWWRSRWHSQNLCRPFPRAV